MMSTKDRKDLPYTCISKTKTNKIDYKNYNYSPTNKITSIAEMNTLLKSSLQNIIHDQK